MKNLNLQNVQESTEFAQVKAGGYIARICGITDESQKEYIKLALDIADGEFKDYYNELYKSKGFWGLTSIRSYKETALPFFKSFITAVETSNPGYKFDYNEQLLKGKLVGIVLQEEEYIKNDGSIGIKLVVQEFRSVEKIKNGDFKVKDKKCLVQETPKQDFMANVVTREDDIEF